jgi:uncharacterized repeat protein (TIGR01451 family)
MGGWDRVVDAWRRATVADAQVQTATGTSPWRRWAALAGVLATTFVVAPVAPAQAVLQSGEGMLRVTSNPAVPTQVIVDGVPRDTWGLNWLELPPGVHVVEYTDVPGFVTPPPVTVSVFDQATTVVRGDFVRLATLRVNTSPAVPAQISIDGQPADQWGVWTDLPAGVHEICFGDLADFTAPACQTVNLVAGVTTEITGTYTPSPGAPGETNVGYLRVVTDPAVPSQIVIDGTRRSTWSTTWVEMAPGTYDLSFTDVPGFLTPAPTTVTIAAGQTTTVNGNFTRLGTLRVVTDPAVISTISVDGVVRDVWGLWTDLLPGAHQVCFETVPGFDPVPCQNVTLVAGETTTVTGGFVVEIPRPVIASITPPQAHILGGKTVTISGSNFAVGGTTFSFGGTAATGVSCASTTSCTAVVPARATLGAVVVTATANGKTSLGVPFTYVVPPYPAITTITPNRGLLAGGNTVTLTGLNFLGDAPATIVFGGVAGQITCTTSTSCTAVVPPRATAGTVNVSVNVDGLPSSVRSYRYAQAIVEPPTPPRNITVFPARDFVSTEFFPANDGPYTVEVWRNVGGNLVRIAQSTPVTPDPAGLMEVNHPGGGCWVGVTPDITGGDIVRVVDGIGLAEQTHTADVTTGPLTVIGPAPGLPGRTRVEVRGRAADATGAQLPIDTIEHRFVSGTLFSNGRRTLRAPGDGTISYDSPTSTSWTAVYDLAPSDLTNATQNESRIMWLGADPLVANESTIAERGPAVVAGPQAPCTAPLENDTTPPTAPVDVAAVQFASPSLDSVHVTWGAATDNRSVTGYRVYRNGSLLVTRPATSRAFDDINLVPATYTYQVSAIDAAGNESPLAPIPAIEVTTQEALEPDLTVAIATLPAGDLTVGQNVTFQVTVTNIGELATSGPITVTQLLPAGLTLVSATDSGGAGTGFSCTSAPSGTGRLVTCTAPGTVVIGPLGTKEIDVVTTPGAAAVPMIATTATVSNASQPVTSNDSDSLDVLVDVVALDVNDPPFGGVSVIAFPARDFVSIDGYAPTDVVTVEIWRDGDVIARSRGNRINDAGLVEVNHPGGGCWAGDPLHPFGAPGGTTPNLQPGDVVRAIDQFGDAHQTTIAGVRALAPTNPTPGTIVIRGSAQDATGAPLPLAQLEQRLVSAGDLFEGSGRRTLRAASVGPADGTLAFDGLGTINWTAVYTGLSEADVALAMASESRIMWLGIDPLAGNQLTIHEVGSAVAKGPAEPCTAPADTVTPIPSRPDIGVASSHAGDFQVGVAASYVLTVDNVGTGPNTGVITVHHDLPDGITYVGYAGASQWTCSTFVQRVTCFRTGVLAAGNSDSVTIEVAVSALAVPGGAAISAVSTPLDRDPANNRALDPTVVLA